MAPKKKNGFMIFTFEWKAKYGVHLSLRDATTEAGKLWAEMGPQERAPYNKKAKTQQQVKVEKLTCTGVPVSYVEMEKQENYNKGRTMKNIIDTTVHNSVKNGELDTQKYFFIMVNYFTKTTNSGVHVPAEISVAEYSLRDGVNPVKYHSFINPGVTIYGHQYEAQQYSESTHQLPLPPKAMGETNLGKIYNDVLDFIVNKDTGELPPVYTTRESLPIVQSVMDFLKADVGARNLDVRIYCLQYLFYVLKEATCELGEIEKPKSIYITDAYFERDFFEYQIGIACQYHEDIDKSKYCTKSYVTRWGYMFSDYMCRDIAVALVPGRHVPESTNLKAIMNSPPSNWDDSKSCISGLTESSIYTNALSEYKIYNEDQKSTISDMTYREDLTPNFSGNRRRQTNLMSPLQNSKSGNLSRDFTNEPDSADGAWSINPWASRSFQRAREPESVNFNIDYSYNHSTANRSLNNSFTRETGRGNINYKK